MKAKFYHMGYFATLREKRSGFYRWLWDEIATMPVVDTHEHFDPVDEWIGKMKEGDDGTLKLEIPQILGRSYIHVNERGTHETWAKELREHRGTGYLKAWMIAMEELHGVETQEITPSYLEAIENAINEAYADDFRNGTYSHMERILSDEMHVKHAIMNVAMDQHIEYPVQCALAAAGIPSVLDGIQVPPDDNPAMVPNVVYNFAYTKLGLSRGDFQTLDDYCDATEKLLTHLRDSGNYCCIKMQMAYNRPLWFPEPPDDDSKIRALFGKPVKSEKDLWKFGDFMMHFVLEWTSIHWRVPYQLHTGLARMYDGGSNALNLSHLFQKFPDVHFDLFHGNYPYNNLGGMLHQIPNISADLCWLPAISPTAAERTLLELLEVGDMVSSWPNHVPSMRTCLYGGDSGIIEGSYGALQIAKDVLVRVLEDLHDRGHILKVDAVDLARRVLHDNPKRIFNL